MAYQFIHYETYNAKDARDCIGEGLRLPGHCEHVPNPKPPVILYGSVEGLADKIDALKSTTKRQVTQKTRSGLIKTFDRSLRDNEHVCLMGVVSWGREWAEENPRLYQRSKSKTLKKLQKDYGSQLVAAVFHDDEAQPHLHFWVIPDGLDISRVCRAAAAEKELNVKRDKSSVRQRDAARLQAMKNYQTEWYHEVFESDGLVKEGPNRRRMTRVEYMAEKKSLNASAKMNMQAEDSRINTAGAVGAMLVQNAKHKADIAAMDAKATAMIQGMTNAQRLEVAKQQKAVEVVNDLLGL